MPSTTKTGAGRRPVLTGPSDTSHPRPGRLAAWPTPPRQTDLTLNRRSHPAAGPGGARPDWSPS